MTCREAVNLIPLLFDGELAPHQMRAVAMHSTLCPACEAELRNLERVQHMVRTSVATAVEEVDFGDFWAGVDRRLVTPAPSVWHRAREWWHGLGFWPVRIPAYAALAAAAALALFYATQSDPVPPRAAMQMAAGGSAWIDSVHADVDSVLVLEDQESKTAVLWVGDRFPGEVE